jgi:hypothetical protein
MSSGIVCFERYRRERNQVREWRLAERPAFESPFGRYEAGPERVLNDRQLAHRQRMLEHLQRKSYVAS